MTRILQSKNVKISVISLGAWSVFNPEIVFCSLYAALYAVTLLTVWPLPPDFIAFMWLIFNIKFIILYVVSNIITLHTSHSTAVCFCELFLFIPQVCCVARINFSNITSSHVMKAIYSLSKIFNLKRIIYYNK
jgi:hypothetical protein